MRAHRRHAISSRVPVLSDDFVPARGLTWTHAQSLLGVWTRPQVNVPVRRERRDTPDGDFVDLDIVDGVPGSPTVILLHGLEGSSSSGYMRLMLRGLHARGWTGIALNQRGCSGEPNRQAKSYSSGDYRDLSWLLKTLKGRVFAVGFSLGASVLLNFLGKDEGASRLDGAAAVSAPYDLAAGARFLDSGGFIARQYLAHFLPTMKAKALQKAPLFPSEFDVDAINAAKTMRDFDHVVTAQLFGFGSAENYYAQCSAGPLLERIRTRTLLLSAHDDALAFPTMPMGTANNPALDVLLTKHGGHVGFITGSTLRPDFWAEQRVLRWLENL